MVERLKTAGIFVLLALMMLLLYGNLTLGMDGDPLGLGDPEKAEIAMASADSRWPLVPTLLALGADGAYYVPLTQGEWELLLSQAEPLLAEAVGSMAEPALLDSDTAWQWLREGCLLVGYEDSQPLSALRAWSDAGEPVRDPAVSRMLLRLDQGRVVIALWDKQSGSWYSAVTAAGPQQLVALGERFARANATLAGEHAHLSPYTFMLDETGPLPVSRATLPDFASGGELPRSVLAAFGINSYLAKVYREESTGDTVYVDNYSAVRITAEGELIFTASAGQGIAPDSPTDAAAAVSVRDLSNRVWDLLGAGGELTLSGVTPGEDGSRLLAFDLLIGGRPVSWKQGYAVTARMENGLITAIIMRPMMLEETGETAQALGFRYGALLVEGLEDAVLSLCYEQRADGLLAPALRVED